MKEQHEFIVKSHALKMQQNEEKHNLIMQKLKLEMELRKEM